MGPDDNGGGFDWAGLSDFVNSVEGPTLGIISLARGGSVSQSGPQGTISATSNPNGTFAGPGAGGTGQGIPAAADIGNAIVSRPGLVLLGLAAIVALFAVLKS